MTLLALSFTRPWPALVLDGSKPVENRSWRIPRSQIGRDIVVYAAKSWDTRAALTATRILHRDWAPLADAQPVGYVGLVRIAGMCDLALRERGLYDGDGCTCGPWAFDGQYHWQLENPRPFDAPIPGGGRLGLWPVNNADVLAAVAAIWAGEDAG